ncbi:MAG: TlyA family RNA methyltransferase [Peptococcaceae bacterium]|jgi:23S rRNA (cytidine1920-2'-O)/16S rRNA (cytidine1409-2'-O)-methyltransferase|nr:TlyA family RNA methyltransferase [Peptococcaceae bacterium]
MSESKMSEPKMRLDLFLLSHGFCESREKARALIMAGQVFSGGVRLDKAGAPVSPEAEVEVRGNTCPYVSRGGLKLAKAIEVFGVDFNRRAVLDLGASTGGFTDCALQNGARRVYAVDVGYGQLSWKLRQNEKVVVLEKTNARYLSRDLIEEAVDIVTMDLAFISLSKIFPVLPPLMKPEGCGVALIKPQFEAGREKVGKKGVVRDPRIHEEVIDSVWRAAAGSRLCPRGLDFSPVRGPEGNIEYLLWFTLDQGDECPMDPLRVRQVVAEAGAVSG